MWARDLDAAWASAARALELAPSHSPAMASLGLIQLYSGQAAQAIERLERAIRLDPGHPDAFLHFLGQACYQLGRYAEAAAHLRQRLVLSPDSDSSRLLLAATLGQLGQPAAAREVWQELLVLDPTFSLEQRRRILPFRDPADFERIVEGLAKAGLPDTSDRS